MTVRRIVNMAQYRMKKIADWRWKGGRVERWKGWNEGNQVAR
jgi:hypothetical protein